MRHRPTVEELVKRLENVRVEVRCGLCCHAKEPCDKCKEETRLANWHLAKLDEEVPGFRQGGLYEH